MRFALRTAVAAAFALAPLSINAQTAGKNLAIDFRTTVTVSGMPDTGVILGHAVGSGDKLRMDLKMKGPGAQVSPLGSAAGQISMILSDSGKTVTYLDSTNSKYLRVRPSDMLAQAQQMGGLKMDFSGTEAKVDSLGVGPTILGHPTSHYRVGSGMTVTISAMGQEQTVKITTSSDYYYATDIKGVVNPFARATPLRASSASMIISQGQSRITTTEAEVTSVQWVDANPKTFEVPSSYTAVTLPGMGPTQGGAIPPK